MTAPVVTARRMRLFTPGPVEIPMRVLKALAQEPPHHRTDGFRQILRAVTEELKWLHGTTGEVFLLAASGTGAMEAAVVNLMAPGEKALAILGGKFGERWAGLLKAYGIAHETIDVAWGSGVDPAEVERRLEMDRSIAAVFATHSETSTGAIHDVEALAKITRARGKRLIVDAITSVGVHPLPQDAWGIDAVVCGSQKGLMIPPGIATLSLAPWAAPLIDGDRLPRFYFDLRKARKSFPLGETAFTPPVSLVLALEESLAMIREEGLDHVHTRHRKLAHAVRVGAEALGFGVFPKSPSHAVTALTPPEGIDASAVVKRLREAHAMVVAGGQDSLKGKILRIGHMGAYQLADIEAVVAALEECVTALGRPATGGVARARAAWERA
ncbi:MAG TPA: alanine--glyoxylate aminotransferase family protein [Candidatus Eisenbacteria bacterium]|nr:alanine--glyoxylate aminotransferase family protein [Candidatus Eisenbacteria bacterium]